MIRRIVVVVVVPICCHHLSNYLMDGTDICLGRGTQVDEEADDNYCCCCSMASQECITDQRSIPCQMSPTSLEWIEGQLDIGALVQIGPIEKFFEAWIQNDIIKSIQSSKQLS